MGTRHYSSLQQHKHVSLQKGSHPEGGVGPLWRRRTVVLRVCGRMRDVGHKHKEWRDLDLSSESERECAQKHTHTGQFPPAVGLSLVASDWSPAATPSQL